MTVINSTGPNGESLAHDITITSVNTDGTYNYYDPTDENTYSNESLSLIFAFGLTSPKYAYGTTVPPTTQPVS